MSVTFGWRIPDFPVDGSSPDAFREQIFPYLDTLHGHFDAVWVGDHFFPWMDRFDQTIDTIEAWTTLTYVLGRYPQFRGGTIVLSQGYRPPALLAKMALNLQWLSNGRLILGIGAGWKENEYKAFGYPFPTAGARIAELDEAVQVIRAMFRDPSPTFHGETYQIETAYGTPRTTPPPLLIGGSGRKKTLRVVAKYADMLNFANCSPENYRELLDVLEEHCHAVGRDITEIGRTYAAECAAIAPDRSEVDRLLRESPFGEWDTIAGTPDEMTRQIEQYTALGVEHIILRFPDFPDTTCAERFIRDVLPNFQK
jgi:alkanesulfonate monooxygenase SsuD/methylene tetrahydromethanopterin reductase-like flavin-dependent oxidoreductase (luciferase family)